MSKSLGLSQQAILHLGIGGSLKQKFASEATLAVLAVVSLPHTSIRYYYTFILIIWPFSALDTARMYLDRVHYHPYNRYILRECFGRSVADGTEQIPRSHRGADFGCSSAPLFGEGLREHHHPGHRERTGRPYERCGVPPL